MRYGQSSKEVYERNRALTQRAMRLTGPSRAAMTTGLQARYQPPSVTRALTFVSPQPTRSLFYDASRIGQARDQPELFSDFRHATRRSFTPLLSFGRRHFAPPFEPLVVRPSLARPLRATADEMGRPWFSARSRLKRADRVGSVIDATQVFARTRGTSYAVPDAVVRAAMAASAFADPATATLATRASLMEPGALSGFLRHLEGRDRRPFTDLHEYSHRVASWLNFLRPELEQCAPDEVVRALRWARALHRRFSRRLPSRTRFTAKRTTIREIASTVMAHGPPLAFEVPRRPTGARGCR